jgi:phage replication initiation protein
MFVDWLSVTVPGDSLKVKDPILSYFGTSETLDGGGMGYDCSAKVCGTGRVFWASVRQDMGVHVRLPASALKALPRDALSVLGDFLAMQGKATRLDLAADDFNGLLNMDVMREKILKKEFVCRARSGSEVRSLFGGAGHTLYFGSRESDTFLRIYDKAAEQADLGVDVSCCPLWIRTEMELKNNRADAAAQYIYTHREDWQIEAAGWLLNFLDYKDPGTDSNVSRWDTSPFWSAFVEDAKKSRIVSVQQERTVEDVRDWIDRQVTPSLFVLEATVGHEEVFQMVAEGSGRLKDHHKKMIEDYNKMLAAMNRGGVENVETH